MTASVTDSKTSYAAEVARLLWPEPWAAPYVTRGRRPAAGPHRDAYLFPNERRARLLVPTDVPGSSSMLRRLGRGRISFAGPVGGLVERAVASRAFALAGWPMLRIPVSDPGADSIESYLGRFLETEVRVGVLLGTRRANQKPVLQVFDRDGELVAYAKVGHNELTAALVQRETESLTTLSRLGARSFEVPRVLHHGQWSGLEVLLISPLSTDRRRPVPPGARLAAMREVARLNGTTESPLAASAFWARIHASADGLGERPRRGRLLGAIEAIERRHGSEGVTLGAWHGDWGNWNMGMGDRGLKLWDWERFDVDVPVGFDAVHYAAQEVQPGRRDATRQEASFVRGVSEQLGSLGVDRARHDLTLQLYLLEIAIRYEDALTLGPLPALEARTAWVLSLLEGLVHDDHDTVTGGRR
jgi:hypothetical protein